MTERNANVLGLWTIFAIVIVVAAALGALNGLFGARLGLPSVVRSVLVLVPVVVLARVLIRGRLKALGQQDHK